MHRSELFHVGIVVADLAAAKARLGDLLDVTWGPVIEFDNLEVLDAGGVERTIPNRFCYSTEPPYLELIQAVPGTAWELNESSNLHHVGFFTSDLGGDSNELSSAGCPLLLGGRTGDRAPTSFVYHRDPLGVVIELVDEAVRPVMAEMVFRAAGDA